MSGPSAPRFAAAMHRAAASAQPLSALLELTYACRWRCHFCCNARHHDVAGLSGDEWVGILDGLRDLGTLWVTLTGGDPLAHPEFLRVAKAARERAFGLRVFTNGELLDDALARELSRLSALSVELSVHGATPELHDAIVGRPGAFAAMVKALDVLVGHGVRVVLKSLVTRRNEDRVDDLVDFAARRGVEHRLSVSLTPRDGGDLSPLRHRATPAGAERVFFRLHAAGALPSVRRTAGGTNCGIGQSTMAIDPEGNVFPCIQWRDEPLGNARRAPLREIWNSPLRERATEISRAANARILEAGGPLADYPFCPAVAFLETGDPTLPSAALLEEASAATRAREPHP